MFVVQNMLNELDDKKRKWQQDCDKWISEGGEYSYRTVREYERKHPRPDHILRIMIASLPCFVVVCLVSIFLLSIVFKAEEEYNHIANATRDGSNCRMFDLNDHVKINAGEYFNTQGTIIGGCNKGEEYQIKLDDGSKANIRNDDKDAVDVSGRIIGIRSYKDLVKIN
jgi:hypothetical protein